MKKAVVVMLSLVVGIAGVAFKSAYAADKFGYVSIERVGDSYLKAKEYMKALEGKQTGYTQEIDKKRNELKALQDKLNLLNDKEKITKTAELEQKVKEFQAFVQSKDSDLRKEHVDKTIELSKEIKDAIDKYAAQDGFTIIFDAAALAYQPKNMDVTDKIIDMLNSSYKPKS